MKLKYDDHKTEMSIEDAPDGAKVIHFDLGTNIMKKHFYKSNLEYLKGYKIIKDYFEKNGFVHYQYSGYFSKEPIETHKCDLLILTLAMKEPWLWDCIEDASVTEVPKNHSNVMETINLIKKTNIVEMSKKLNGTEKQAIMRNTIEYCLNIIEKKNRDKEKDDGFDIDR